MKFSIKNEEPIVEICLQSDDTIVQVMANNVPVLFLYNDGSISLNSCNAEELKNMGFLIEDNRVMLNYIPQRLKG
ncbi:MAG: hypothetical protein KGI11_09915 [Thaumarchaeota archaeon]|nr:hypothetical protein [Nitrososphaerota archaeon]